MPRNSATSFTESRRSIFCRGRGTDDFALEIWDIELRSLLGRTVDQGGMEIDPAAARRRHGRLCPGPQVLTRGSDDLEVGGAGDGHEALANRVDQPSFAAHQSWHGLALDECPALDTGF